jgi:CarD family transcriptional regulator
MKSTAGSGATVKTAARKPAPATSEAKTESAAKPRAQAALAAAPARRTEPEEQPRQSGADQLAANQPAAKKSPPAAKAAEAARSRKTADAEPDAEIQEEPAEPAGQSAARPAAKAKVAPQAAPESELEAEDDDAADAGVEPDEDAEDEEEEQTPASGRPAGSTPPGLPPHLHRPPPRPLGPPETYVEGDHVVYPTHGVGKVERIAVEEIAGHKLELIHITFEENRMTLRVPVAKARTAGLRKLASRDLFDKAMDVLRGRARIKRTMWSRRAQEYEAKINSGDPLAIAEVVRDLHRNAGQPDQSFSERQIYEQAMDRLAAELAALERTDKATAATKLSDFLKTV